MKEKIPYSLQTYKDRITPQFLSDEAKELIAKENEVPVDIAKNESLRLKVIDNCGHACTFCHNEGTQVNDKQAQHRVSVFLPSGTNKSDIFIAEQFTGFKALPMEHDDPFFSNEINRARDVLGIKEIHLTGGEPTQHQRLPEVVRTLVDSGLKVKMTSNGERGAKGYKELKAAGLDSVNISIFGSTPEEYAETQPAHFGIEWAAHKLNMSRKAIAAAKDNGIDVKSNCVMTDPSQAGRINRLIERAQNEGFELRILNDLANGEESIAAIYNFLASIKAEPVRRKISAGASGAVTYFQLDSGQQIGFKQIRNVRLGEACKGCGLDDAGKCEEGYYGLRMYKREDVPNGENPYYMGVCIQRMDLALPTDQFYSSRYPESIKNLTEKDYQSLVNTYQKT